MPENCAKVNYDYFKGRIFSDSFTTERVQSRAAKIMGGQLVPNLRPDFMLAQEPLLSQVIVRLQNYHLI